MSQDDLARLRRDVATIRHAIKEPLPFNRQEMWLHITFVPCGVVLAVGVMVVPWERMYVLPLLIPLLVVFGLLLRANRRRWSGIPASAYYAAGIATMILLLVAVSLYMAWERAWQVPREMVGAAPLFFVGFAAMWWGLIDRRRRHEIGAGLPLMAFGLSLPLLEPRAVGVSAGVAVVCGGLLQAAIMHWQLRRHETPDAHHQDRHG